MSEIKNLIKVGAGLGNEVLEETADIKLDKNISIKLAKKLQQLDAKKELTYLERAKLIVRFIRTIERNAKL